MARRATEQEGSIQIEIFKWWAINHHKFDVDEFCLLHIPNGGARNKQTAFFLKKLGVRAGVPDMLLAVPRGNYAGAWIELKPHEQARVQESQKDMLVLLSLMGYFTAIAYGYEQAIDTITRYLLIK